MLQMIENQEARYWFKISIAVIMDSFGGHARIQDMMPENALNTLERSNKKRVSDFGALK